MSNAIRIENLHFSYGKNVVLQNYCSQIRTSEIYSLLGPSGGGKTTLLKLVLGRLKVQSGNISVLGLPPGQANSSISFMPQEIGLCRNFTINQTFRYFKLVFQISNEEFYTRRKTLSKLVNLPKGDMLVGQLSGGTQRRFSIVVALINNPSLVILDEPTVGIDALLRNQIWDYLVTKKNEGMTIIIVTHYIEEAANSDRVGLMRNGRLLAEDNPKVLMAQYQEPNLEAVFLKLCCFEDSGLEPTKEPVKEAPVIGGEFLPYAHFPAPIINGNGKIDPNNNQVYSLTGHFNNYLGQFGVPHPVVVQLRPTFTIKLMILLTLIYKNFIKFFYSYFSLIIIFLPAIQAIIYCTAVSKNIVELKTAVFDEEPTPGYGQGFLNQIQIHRHYKIKTIMHPSLESAIKAVENREVIGALWIPKNYTESLEQRIDEGLSAENHTIEASTIKVYMDNTIFLYGMEFKNIMFDSMINYSKVLFGERNQTSILSPFDIEMTEKSKNIRFKDYYLPGYFMYFMYVSQIVVAALTLTQERKDGLYERSLVSGVTHELVFVSHIASSFIISLIQLFLLYVTIYGIFDNHNNGSLWLTVAFFSLEILNAMALGFVISALIDQEIACIILVWFITIPQILSSGMFWPIQSVREPYVYLFHMWPLTIPTKIIRRIVLRNWDISNQFVQYGILSSAIPMLIFFAFALVIFKRK